MTWECLWGKRKLNKKVKNEMGKTSRGKPMIKIQ